jgi:large subunit ribosomal protein L2
MINKLKYNSIRKYKGITPSLRHRIRTIKPKKKKIIKKLSIILKKKGGRNNSGRITLRHRGGGLKRNLRLIDLRRKWGKYSNSRLVSIEYDPNRTSFIGRYMTKKLRMYYILAPLNISLNIKGRKSNEENKYKEGDILKIRDIPIGTKINNIELYKNDIGKISRSAGSYSTLISKTNEVGIIRLPSKKIIEIDIDNYATIGQLSHDNNKLIVLGKAGASRCKGIRPTVRGYAMNAVDHPHGGKTHGGMQPKTKWGKQAKWIKKKKNKK